MQSWLSFIAGVLTVIGTLLIGVALTGATYYGIGAQILIVLSIILLIIAGITAWMFYVAVKAQYSKVNYSLLTRRASTFRLS